MSRWLQTAGCMSVPRSCDICSCRDRVAFHGESYYHIGRSPALCRHCHRAIHRRHVEWRAWRAIVEPAAITGDEWFVIAPRGGLDLAAHLRRKWTWKATDIRCPLLWHLPPKVAARLPTNLVTHPAL